MSDAATHRVPANTDPGPTPSTTPVTPINNENPSTAAFAPAPSPEATIESAGKLVYLKRSEFLSHMLRSIDIIVYTHISYLYLLEYTFPLCLHRLDISNMSSVIAAL